MNVLKVDDLDRLFNKKIKELKPDLFIEAGAWNGQQSIKVKGLVPSCDVNAYEANTYVYDSFLNTFEGSLAKYHNIALSDEQGKAKFKVQLTHRNKIVPKTKKNNSLKERTEAGVQYEEIEVVLDTIDGIYSRMNHKSVAMWIDVEGVGLEVLKGAEKVLEKTNLIKIEVESQRFWEKQHLDTEIIEYLESKGFTAESRDEERTGQYNIIFVK